MKNLWVYYSVILLPLFALALLGAPFLSSIAFTLSLLAYALIYRPIVDSMRLKAVREFDSAEMWKLYIPFYGHLSYFKDLYLK